MQKIRIGLIGAGANTVNRHIPGFQSQDNVEIVVVANRSKESSRRVADKFGIPRVADRWQSVVEDPEVDAICIGTWPYLHAEAGIATLRAGKHLLCEARMAATLDQAYAMLEAHREHPDRVAQIVPSPFTLPCDGAVAEILRSGSLGKLREIHVQHTTAMFADPDAPMSWRQDPEVSGINMLTMGIYHEAVLRWLPIQISSLQAWGSIHTRRRMHWDRPEEVEVLLPDSLSIQAMTTDEIHLFYYFSAVETGRTRNEVRIHGDRGSLRIEVETGTIHRSLVGDPTERIHEYKPDPGWQVEADFVHSIRSGRPVTRTSFADGVRYMEFTDRVHRALNRSQA